MSVLSLGLVSPVVSWWLTLGKPKESVKREIEKKKRKTKTKKRNRRVGKQGKTKDVADNKMERGPSHKQWRELILFGTLRENIDQQSELDLLSLWKTLPKGKRFTPLEEVSKSQGFLRVSLQ